MNRQEGDGTSHQDNHRKPHWYVVKDVATALSQLCHLRQRGQQTVDKTVKNHQNGVIF